MATHTALIAWNRTSEGFLKGEYSRVHTWASGLPCLQLQTDRMADLELAKRGFRVEADTESRS